MAMLNGNVLRCNWHFPLANESCQSLPGTIIGQVNFTFGCISEAPRRSQSLQLSSWEPKQVSSNCVGESAKWVCDSLIICRSVEGMPQYSHTNLGLSKFHFRFETWAHVTVTWAMNKQPWAVAVQDCSEPEQPWATLSSPEHRLNSTLSSPWGPDSGPLSQLWEPSFVPFRLLGSNSRPLSLAYACPSICLSKGCHLRYFVILKATSD
jgi:hypothetical protein